MNKGAPDFTQALTTFVPEVVRQRVSAISAADGKDIECPQREPFETVALFADVSGFTKLSEALAVKGPGGAEDLAFYLNRYLERLSKVIARSGGDVFKFAGDAMLVLWPPDPKDKDNKDALANKVHRAAQCSLDIQSELHNAELAENVRLSVKLGIGVGEALVLYVGGVYKRVEYLSCGKPFNEAFHCEHLAEPGDTILSIDAWKLVGGHFRGEQRADAMRLLGIINPIRNKSIRSQVYNQPSMGDLLRRFIPAAVIPHLKVNEEFWAGELRQISCVFVNLGFNASEITSSPDSLGLVQKVISTVQRSVYDFEGSLNKFLIDDKGSTLIAVWGLPPLAHEDDPKRAVLACIKMRRLMADMNLACSCGITSGLALCGLVGAGSRREYTVLGDVVNLSARLMQAALAETKGTALPIARPVEPLSPPSSLSRRDSKQHMGGLSGSLLINHTPPSSLADEKEPVIIPGSGGGSISRGHMHSSSSSSLAVGSNSSRVSTMASTTAAASSAAAMALLQLQSPRAGSSARPGLSLATSLAAVAVPSGVAAAAAASEPLDPKAAILSKGLIIDQATYDAATGTSLLTFDVLEPIMVKGKSHPIAIYRPFREMKPRFVPYIPNKQRSIVARETEITRLTDIIDSMLRTRPGHTTPSTITSRDPSASLLDTATTTTTHTPRASISISHTAMKKRASILAAQAGGRHPSASVATAVAPVLITSSTNKAGDLPTRKGVVGPGGGSLVVIQGEVGVGKTRLLQNINSDCDEEVRFIWSVGEQAHSSVPFAYWHRMFMSIMECDTIRSERKQPHDDDPRIIPEQKLMEAQLLGLVQQYQPLLEPVLPVFNFVGRTTFPDTREAQALLYGHRDRYDRAQNCCSDPYPDTLPAIEPIIAVATQVFGVLLRHLCGVSIHAGADDKVANPCVLILDEAQFMHSSDWQLTMAIGRALVLPSSSDASTSSSSGHGGNAFSPVRNEAGLLVGSPLVGTASVGSPLTNGHGATANGHGHHAHHHGPSSQYSTLKLNSGYLSLKPDLQAASSLEKHLRASPLAYLNLPTTYSLVCRLSIFIGTRPLYNKKYRPLFETHAPPEYSELTSKTYGQAEVITLGNGTEDDTGMVLTRHFREQAKYSTIETVHRDLIQLIHARTGGRFGFVIRFAKALDNIGALEVTKGRRLVFRRDWVLKTDFHTELPIPYKIQRTTASHLDRLAPSQIFLLKLASVISVGIGSLTGLLKFDLTLLTHIHNIPAYKASLAGDLLSLQDMGFIYEYKEEANGDATTTGNSTASVTSSVNSSTTTSAATTSSATSPPISTSSSFDEKKNESSPPSAPSTPLSRANTSKKILGTESQKNAYLNLNLDLDSSTPRYFAFTYGFIRDAIYQLMLYKQRQRLHRTAADYIQSKTRGNPDGEASLSETDKDMLHRHQALAKTAENHKATHDRGSHRASTDHHGGHGGQRRGSGGFFARLFSCCSAEEEHHHEKRTSRVILSPSWHREQSSVTSKEKLSMLYTGSDRSVTVDEKKAEDSQASRASRHSANIGVTSENGKRPSAKGSNNNSNNNSSANTPTNKDKLLTSETELSDMKSLNLQPLVIDPKDHTSSAPPTPIISSSASSPSGLSLALAQHRGTLAGSPRERGSASPRGGLHGVAFVIDTVKLLEGAEDSARRAGILPASPTTMARDGTIKQATFSQRTSDLLGVSPILDASLLQSEGPESPDGSDLPPFESSDYANIAAICRTTAPSPTGAVLTPTSDRARALLLTSSQWSFDIFDFTEMAGGGASPLLYMGYHLFHVYDLPRRMNIADRVLIDFLRDIEYGYNVNENTYHNSIHAADVSQSVHAILFALHHTAERIDPLDLMAIITAAIIHDYRHPGVTNQFLTASQTPSVDADEKDIERILLLKSDPGHLLENFHCLAAFRCMHREKNNILKNLLPDHQRQARIKILRLVMATSLADHFDFIKRLDRDVVSRYKVDLADPNVAPTLTSLSTHGVLTRYLATATPNTSGVVVPSAVPTTPHPSAEDHATLMLLQLLLKCADISNGAKKEKVYQEWLTRIMNEFYRQGDHEREQGLPCSPYMDRYHPDEAKCQAMFISKIVQPLYELLITLAPAIAGELSANLLANRTLAEDRQRFDDKRRVTMSRASVILPLGRGSIVLQPHALAGAAGSHRDSLLAE